MKTGIFFRNVFSVALGLFGMQATGATVATAPRQEKTFEDFSYDESFELSTGDGSSVFVAEQDGKLALLSADGMMITGYMFDTVWGFSDGLSVVEIKKKYGYIDMHGEIVIPCIYDAADGFKNGAASVARLVNGSYRHYLIDTIGQILIGPKEYAITKRGDAYVGISDPLFGTDAPPANRLKTEALLDKNGVRLTGFSHAWIDSFNHGLAIVSSSHDKDNQKFGVINHYGVQVVPQIYDYIEYIDDHTYVATVYEYDGVHGRIAVLTLTAEAASRLPTPRSRAKIGA